MDNTQITAESLLRRALDAWDDEGTFDYLGTMDCLMEEIRTFLAAEPEAPVECVHVPLTIWKHLKEGRITAEDLVDAVKKANAEERAKEEAEPVAWIRWAVPYGQEEPVTVVGQPGRPKGLQLQEGNWFPVYLHPPRPEPARKPMTDEEILEAARDHYNPNQRAEISFARAIEKHHGIGGYE